MVKLSFKSKVNLIVIASWVVIIAFCIVAFTYPIIGFITFVLAAIFSVTKTIEILAKSFIYNQSRKAYELNKKPKP